MCGFAGFWNAEGVFEGDKRRWTEVLEEMGGALRRRGPDDHGIYLGKRIGLSHTRLSIQDPAGGEQPMERRSGDGHHAAIVFNGEIYNSPELRARLSAMGVEFQTTCDTEVLLFGYLYCGTDFFRELNGIFAFAIWDESLQKLILVRDRMGVKPLFYTNHEGNLVFSSELKGLFVFPGVKPAVNREGLCEILGLGPAKTPGKGVFTGCLEVLPGEVLETDERGLRKSFFWTLESRPHEESYEETVEHTRHLVTDSIKLQMLSDVPICTFLSGGIDSSLVTSVCSTELKKQGKVLDTYSFDFRGNETNFKASDFQPSQDRPYVDLMAAYCGSRHHYLECGNEHLPDCLRMAVDARDLPCMADVEGSMLYFCSLVSKEHKVTLTGECADEIFGGYPWFHKKESFLADTFPWSTDFTLRTALLRDEVREALPLEDYAREAYRQTISQIPVLEEDSPEEKRRREIAYLNLRWFMQTLLDRMDRTAMYNGLEARVPFADHRIVEYLWNVPWSMKCPGGVVKGLLRESARGLLPEEILTRKKSPYPKTYDPSYERLLGTELLSMLSDPAHPLCELVDPKKVSAFLSKPSDYGRPFYGQLMAGPQLLAYLLQIGYWLERYHLSPFV